MTPDIESFHEEFFQDLQGSADAEGRFLEDAFFEKVTADLIEAGELDMADRAFYSAKGIRVDGYGGDPADTEGVLSLIVLDFFPQGATATLTGSDMDTGFNRALRFLQKALDPAFRSSLEETSPAYGLCDLISGRWSSIAKVRVFLLTNRRLSSRVDSRPEGDISGVPISFSVWDIERLYRFAAIGRGREPIDISFGAEYGNALPALPAHLDDAGYEAYLAVVPGRQLATIYEQWGARLLEQNVRSFLQARGGVNAGIRQTLENNPEMFFAYNNGISATAEAVETRGTRDGLVITRIRNLQIVNGGQTTASVAAAARKKSNDLSRVFVQMKLAIVDPSRTMEVVPRISQYANTQNKINTADFFANHPFHVRIEEFSRRIYAPSPAGTFRQTKWFYERARGQYQDARANLTQAQRNKFDLEYPKHQVFVKTDLAKYIEVWRELPHVVSTGAQKNFAKFAEYVECEWDRQSDAFNELYYREVVAKAIVFRQTERIVSDQPWYSGGYRAQIVAYAVSKLAQLLRSRGAVLDFEAVWKAQECPAPLRRALVTTARAANDVLANPPAGMRNVTEWAKKTGCWERLAGIAVTLPELDSVLLDTTERKLRQRGAVKEQRVLNGIEAQIRVVNTGPEYWRRLAAWGTERKLISEMERDILNVAARVPDLVPSEKQCAKALETLAKLEAQGWTDEGV